MRRKRFKARERPEGRPSTLDQQVAASSSVETSTASLVRRHVDEYFRLSPNDALRLSGVLLSTEGLSGVSEVWRRQLIDEIYQHTKQSIRCEVGFFTWLMLGWRLYQIIRLIIEIYQADPQQMGSVADVPATKIR